MACCIQRAFLTPNLFLEPDATMFVHGGASRCSGRSRRFHCQPDEKRSVKEPQPSKVATKRRMPVDLCETENTYEVYADVPGVSKNNLQVTLEDGVLTLKVVPHQESNAPLPTAGAHAPGSAEPMQAPGAGATAGTAACNNAVAPASAEQAEERDVSTGFVEQSCTTAAEHPGVTSDAAGERRRSHNFVTRRIRLPKAVDEESVSAKCEDGVLKVVIEKTKPAVKQRRVQVQ